MTTAPAGAAGPGRLSAPQSLRHGNGPFGWWLAPSDRTGTPCAGHSLPDRVFRLAIGPQERVPPVWPAGPGDPQMMMHLEIKVGDVDSAVAKAVALGAILAGFQPQDDVRVCLDPAGHPSCLYVAAEPVG